MSPSQLPDQTRLSQVRLRTADLERALGFYSGTLGFEVLATDQNNVALSPPGKDQPLIVLTHDPKAPPRPPRTTGLFHLAIRYPARSDLAAAFLRLARRNYPLQGASDHIVSEALYLADPDGNGVELYTDRPRSQWSWRNGQIAMSTERLDLDDLLATATNHSTDSPMPTGTDLGHLHLNVADLAAAARFYNEFLGLAVTQRSYPGALFLSAGGYHHHIAVNTWAGRASPPSNAIGLISYRLEVPEPEVLYCLRHRAPLLGYQAKTEPAAAAQAPDILQILDPNGASLEIQSNKPGDQPNVFNLQTTHTGAPKS
ncbi:MAG: Glyoxalase/bleomycin resistance protein/dioxygenase [Pedosphaera sp.]|nr:Glyoxalase/bleomycin resistance protein/dioxygenase [Pedosphaera sp.]